MKGKWQRIILAELHSRPAFYVNELLKSGYTRAQYVAVLRAAGLLEVRQLIEVKRFQFWAGSRGRVVVHRVGYEFDRLKDSRDRWNEKCSRANVDKVSLPHLVNKTQGGRP